MTTTDTAPTVTPEQRRENLLHALSRFIAQRPGLEFANYGDAAAYRAESRSITADRRHAEALLAAVSWRTSITAGHIVSAARGAYSGRLTITEPTPGRFVLDYCAGQYFPTEYRRAVCAVLSSALWEYFRENMPAPEYVQHGTAGEPMQTVAVYGKRRESAGDYLRATARRELPRAVAARWFR